MFRVFIFVICCKTISLLAVMKISDPQFFDSLTDSTFDSPYTCYNSENNSTFLSWSDKYTLNNRNPWFAIFDWNTLSFKNPPTKISEDIYVLQEVTCSYIEGSNQVVVSWREDGTADIFFTLYDCSIEQFVVSPTRINQGAAYARADNDIFTCNNFKDNTVIFSWANSNDGYPYLAVYDCSSSSFSVAPKKIDASFSGVAKDNVFLTYNSIDNTILFSWVDDSDNSLYYALYDCNSNSTVVSPNKISNGFFKGNYNLFSCYNSIANTFVLGWTPADGSNPFYAVLDGNALEFKVSPTQIRADLWYLGANDDPFLTYNPSYNSVLFTWPVSDQTPYLASYDCNSNLFPSDPLAISTDPWSVSTVTNSLNTKANSFFITWSYKYYQGLYSLYYDQNYWLIKELKEATSVFFQKN